MMATKVMEDLHTGGSATAAAPVATGPTVGVGLAVKEWAVSTCQIACLVSTSNSYNMIR